MTLPAVAGLPVDQGMGNLEGKEIRFGTSAGATYAAVTTDVTCGAVNAEADSLNPIAALSPMVGMWLNCIFGGKGVGMINMLLYIIIGIFVAGMMVGRTPEYLGKKIGAREVKLAIIALLVHPLMILLPTGLFAATDWGLQAISNPGAHGFSQILYQFSSASANNGSAFDGLGVVYGFANNPNPAPTAVAWDIAAGLVMLFSRFLPIIAPIAMAAFLGTKKTSPFGLGTLRDDYYHVWRASAGNDSHYRRPSIFAGCRPRAIGGALGAHTFRGLTRVEFESPEKKLRIESKERHMSKASKKGEPLFPAEQPQTLRRARRISLLDKEMAVPALKQAFVMLRPDLQWKNPVMFVVEVGAFLTLLYIIRALWGETVSEVPISYFIAVDIWLFLTVLFANFATALAEARGKAQAQSLRRARHDTTAYRLNEKGKIEEVSSDSPRTGRQGHCEGRRDDSGRRGDH